VPVHHQRQPGDPAVTGWPFDNSTLRTVALGSAALGLVSGSLGAFAVLRRQSLVGDAVSHAALPGIVLAYLATHSKTPLVLALGAVAAGWIAGLTVHAVTRTTRVPFDAALGGVLAVFFGAGLLLLRWLQNRPDASQAGLDRFLFGQAALMLSGDVWLTAGLGGAALLVMLLFWKEFAVLAFDADYAHSLGLPVRLLEVLLTTLIVLAVVVGLQSVGVVLMSAMLVAPAIAARQWTDRLGRVVLLAGLFGAGAGVTGALVSDALSRPLAAVPPGPTIVLCATALVAVSLLAAPGRGLAWAALRGRRS
jgi:manganese/zinc/iron transport system permease protein